MIIDKETQKALLQFQQNEITESLVYKKLAAIEKDPSNKNVLLQIASDEERHYQILKARTGKEMDPKHWRIFKCYWLARLLGIIFAIKLMESSEKKANSNYTAYKEYPDLYQIAQEE